MLRYIFSEEVKYTLKQPIVYVFALLFFVLGYVHFSNTNSGWNGLIRVGSIIRNSDYLIAKMGLSLSIVGIFAVFLPLSYSILKDFSYRTYSLLFTTQLKKKEYIVGRFLGAFLAILLVFVVGFAGIIAGSFFTLPQFLGPHKITAYLLPFVLFVIPNVFFVAALFFYLGTIKKKQLIVYASVLILLLATFLIQGYASDVIRNQPLDNSLIVNLLAFIDPFCNILFQIDTSDWSLLQKNSKPIPLTIMMIVHRVLWIGVGISLLLIAIRRFEMKEPNVK